MTSTSTVTASQSAEEQHTRGQIPLDHTTSKCEPVSFALEAPRTVDDTSACYFYHTMVFPDGETIEGDWTIAELPNYIGNYDLAGKTVLDVGTASGFLTFHAEMAGAKVTATDAKISKEYRFLPFAGTQYLEDIHAWRASVQIGVLEKLRNAFWYAWHKFGSKAEVVYCSVFDFIEWDRRFDVVISGAIIEHLSDPVSAIGGWARLAKEAVIIAFTPAIDTEELVMMPMNPWADPAVAHVWWCLSKGLYRRIFDNLGFDVEFATSTASRKTPDGNVETVERYTIIARRRAENAPKLVVFLSTPAVQDDGDSDKRLFERELKLRDKRIKSLVRKSEQTEQQAMSLKKALQYHSANPLRALRLWWKRHKL